MQAHEGPRPLLGASGTVMGPWPGLIVRGLLYAAVIVLMCPLLALFRVDMRIDYSDDLTFGMEEQ